MNTHHGLYSAMFSKHIVIQRETSQRLERDVYCKSCPVKYCTEESLCTHAHAILGVSSGSKGYPGLRGVKGP